MEFRCLFRLFPASQVMGSGSSASYKLTAEEADCLELGVSPICTEQLRVWFSEQVLLGTKSEKPTVLSCCKSVSLETQDPETSWNCIKTGPVGPWRLPRWKPPSKRQEIGKIQGVSCEFETFWSKWGSAIGCKCSIDHADLMRTGNVLRCERKSLYILSFKAPSLRNKTQQLQARPLEIVGWGCDTLCSSTSKELMSSSSQESTSAGNKM